MRIFSGYFCKSLRAMRPHVVVLFLLNFLSAFMFYFVAISVDGNVRILRNKALLGPVEKEFLVSLESNRTLAFSFLIMLTLIACFVHFMFDRQYDMFHKKEIGCFIACGYSPVMMALVIFLITVCFAGAAHLCGLCLGWFASDVLLNHYKDAYALAHIGKGLDIGNFVFALIYSTILPAVPALPVIMKNRSQDTAELLNGNGKRADIHIGKLIRVFTKHTGFSLRLALRKPFQLLMSFGAVGLFIMLFMMSISLNLSSSYVQKTQMAGRSYAYDVSFQSLQTAEYLSGGDTYLKMQLDICPGNGTVGVTAMGIEQDSRFISLANKNGGSVMDIPEDCVVVSQALSELYGIKQDMVLPILLDDKQIPFQVCGIAENGENFMIYMSKDSLEALLGLPDGSFNGIYTDRPDDFPADEAVEVQSMSDREAELDKNNVSNRMSAVICQILGCVIGCMLIYLTILLKFQEDTKNIFIMDMLGYSSKQINRMFISVYGPVLNIAFILLLLPAAQICKAIHRSLSLATNDYIPFRWNAYLILAVWLLLNLLYSLIKYRFQVRIDRVQKNGEAVKYLS